METSKEKVDGGEEGGGEGERMRGKSEGEGGGAEGIMVHNASN